MVCYICLHLFYMQFIRFIYKYIYKIIASTQCGFNFLKIPDKNKSKLLIRIITVKITAIDAIELCDLIY